MMDASYRYTPIPKEFRVADVLEKPVKPYEPPPEDIPESVKRGMDDTWERWFTIAIILTIGPWPVLDLLGVFG